MVWKTASKGLVFNTICLFLAACGFIPENIEVTAEPTETMAHTATPASQSAQVAEADPAPGFTLSTLDGGEISLSDYEGQWVILNFWATWCPPCVSEMPYLQSLADRGFNVLGVNMVEPVEEVRLFTDNHGIKFPILMNPDINLVLDYQARALPRTVIIAPDGTIALRIAGPVDGEQLDPWLDEYGVQ